MFPNSQSHIFFNAVQQRPDLELELEIHQLKLLEKCDIFRLFIVYV